MLSAAERKAHAGAAAGQGGDGVNRYFGRGLFSFASGGTSLPAVSYTHLTLPTNREV